MEKKTPLYAMHEKYGGKIVPFAGYLLPVQYPQGILHEHHQVREKAGMFDVSHMGEFTLVGKDALKNLNYLLTNDYTNMVNGQVRYGVLCYENGCAVDDLLVYKRNDDYLIVVNASNTDKDFEWMKAHIEGEVSFHNISDTVSQIALQGPLALQVIEKLTDQIPQKNYTFKENVDLKGICVLLSRTGYTGEDGFELYCSNEDAIALWELLLEVGEGVVEPCGLGARDTLRLEAGMPLYGHELSEEINPKESGLSMFIKMDKDFIGKQALIEPPTRKRVGLKLIDRGIAREHESVYYKDQLVGFTTSGTKSPTLNESVAMAIIDTEALEEDAVYEIDVRGRRLKAKRCPLPFYKRKK